MRRKKIKKESKYINQSKLYEAMKEKIDTFSYEEKEVLYDRLSERIIEGLASEEETDLFFLLARYFF